jgi:dienelactone hydrolase
MVPSSVRWGSISQEQERTNRAAWTHKGESLPFNRRFTEAVHSDSDEIISFTPDFLKAMDDGEMARAAAIEVEKINGPIMLISGDDDAMWPGTLFSEKVKQRLEQADFTHEVQHKSYPGAGHLIAGLPYQPTTVHTMFHLVIKKPVALGGTTEADAKATLSGWRTVLQFLEKQLM